MDPVIVADSDYYTWAFRVAAYKYASEKEAAEAERARAAKKQ
jgi:hypothetical protein